MYNPKISVIVPIYNTGKYLEETLMSLVNQSIVDEIEVLMIDDGSNDESRYLIENFALDYDNFFAFHKENEGQGIARNYGLSIAKGEYIHFMDSDDYIHPETYEKLYNQAKKNDDDFVVCNVMKFGAYNCREDILFKNSFKNLNDNIQFNSINDCPSLVWDTISCNKLFKKEFLKKNNLLFLNKKIFFEDILFSFECYIKSNSFSFLNQHLYYWRIRKDLSSVTQQNKTIKNFKDRLEIIQLIKQLIYQFDLNTSTVNKLYEKWLIHDLKMYLKILDGIPPNMHDELIDEIYGIIKDIPHNIKENLPPYQKILYSMIENNDLKALLYFAPLDDKLKIPNFEFNLDNEYMKLYEPYHHVLNEELSVNMIDVDNNNKNIFIYYEYKINYFSNDLSYKIEAFLIDGTNNVYSLEILSDYIILPFDLIENKQGSKILILFSTSEFQKKSFLKNKKRQNICLNDLTFDLGISFNRNFVINSRKINLDEIVIDDIIFDGTNFIFKGTNEFKFQKIFIENVIDFERSYYNVNFSENHFIFKIPYLDIIKTPIKKWEIKCDYLIKLSKSFSFYRQYDEIIFFNKRNSILIKDNLYDKSEKLYKLNDKINKLKKKNNKMSKMNYNLLKDNLKLLDENSNLKNQLNEINSRKILKILNKLKL